MTLINVEASVPSFMWAVVRLLLSLGGKSDEETARRLLTPPTLPAGETKDFSQAIRSLADLGIVMTTEGVVKLTTQAKALSIDDVIGFNRVLRRAALEPERNVGLAETPDLGGPKDLVRALAWFLVQDAYVPLSWVEVEQLQVDAFPPPLPLPFADNDSRWNRFAYWAPTLGFAAQPLLDEGGAVKLVPDCTVAVRETVLNLWEKGQSVSPSEAIGRIVSELPVLPGGAYSRSLGLATPDGVVSPSLSNALLTGVVDGWLTLHRQSDADDIIFLADAGGARIRVTDFTINGSE